MLGRLVRPFASVDIAMSLRKSFPKARLPDTHYFITFSRGDSMRTLAVRPGLLYLLGGVAPVLGLAFVAATAYQAFRDDMLARLASRQTEMQYAYEDRIAGLRAQMDRVTSRQLLDQNSFDGKVHDLLSRQAQLESRGALVAQLAAQVGVKMTRDPKADPEPTKSLRQSAPVRGSANPLLGGRDAPTPLPAGALGFAPSSPTEAKPAKPAPLRGSDDQASLVPNAPSSDFDPALMAQLPVPERLGRIARSLETIEQRQAQQLTAIETKARGSAQALRQVFAEIGLPADKLTAPAGASAAMGGPFVPLKVDPNGTPFERQVWRLQDALMQADKLRRLAAATPLRAPLGATAEQTSGFGARTDPFLGRAAMHAGVDFRDAFGAPVTTTAAGKVVTAGWTGGYGNMVEVDHGNGLSTRYGHMSAITVSEGDHVAAGEQVGRLGSTGRSTGPHLHYEVRIDGDAVDPSKFLRAGRALFGRSAPEKLEL
jgi:murein DD-endopeptidase MepM/ murein hydrolase activator NlpD